MKVHYKDLKNERQWKANAGVSQKQFEILVPFFTSHYKDYFGKSLQDRQNDGTTEACLKSPAELLFFLLFSLKTGLTFDVLGFVFGMDGSNAKRNQDVAVRVLRATLTGLGVMPKRDFQDVEEFEEYFKEHKVLILDGTEQRIQRPENQQVQKACYSGKKNVTP